MSLLDDVLEFTDGHDGTHEFPCDSCQLIDAIRTQRAIEAPRGTPEVDVGPAEMRPGREGFWRRRYEWWPDQKLGRWTWEQVWT